MEYSKNGIAELRDGFPQNVNRFAFKLAKMGPIFVHDLTLTRDTLALRTGCMLVQPALFRSRFPPPAAGANIFAGLNGSRAWCAADAGISTVVQRVVGTSCALMYAQTSSLRPFEQRIDFDQAVRVVPGFELQGFAGPAIVRAEVR